MYIDVHKKMCIINEVLMIMYYIITWVYKKVKDICNEFIKWKNMTTFQILILIVWIAYWLFPSYFSLRDAILHLVLFHY